MGDTIQGLLSGGDPREALLAVPRRDVDFAALAGEVDCCLQTETCGAPGLGWWCEILLVVGRRRGNATGNRNERTGKR